VIGDESCFPLISVFNSYVVVSPSDIHLGEVPCFLELIEEVRNSGEWVGVPNCACVELLLVLAEAESPILLCYKEEGGGLWRFRFSNVAFFEVFFDKCVQFLVFFGDRL
jgi:hypothetical protein